MLIKLLPYNFNLMLRPSEYILCNGIRTTNSVMYLLTKSGLSSRAV